jgi:signal transduction histidine kinase
MTEGRRSGVVVAPLFGLTVLLVAAGLVFMASTLDRASNVFGFRGATSMLTLALAVVGAVLARRRPGNPIGWIFLIAGVASGVQFLAQEYTVFGQARGDLYGAAVADWVDTWIWVPIVGSVAIYVFLLFPTGRPPSPRWRWVLWTGTSGIILFAGAFALGAETGTGLQNPFFDVSDAVTGPAMGVGASLFLGSLVAAAASLVIRFRRSRDDEREQLKWFAAAASLVALFLVASIFSELVIPGRDELSRVAGVGTIVAFMTIPVATGVAVLKYHLYELDVVISRAVLYGALVVIITIVYLGIVVGVGALVGRRGGLVLPGVAAAVVALAFQPLRQRARHMANRLVYGKRATPYEVLSEFSDRVAGTYAAEEILPRMARVLAEGTGADRAEVWLRVGDQLTRRASSPPPTAPASVPLRAGGVPDLPGVERAIAVLHRGELLGALGLAKPRGESVTRAEERLMSNLAAQAGLVLRNVRLIEELRASRQRLVAAQDDERRRLERNLHDGAQQQLVALAVKLRLLRSLAPRDPTKAQDLADQLQAETQDALENLRDLARGIYPPLLADRGLAEALEAQARKSPLSVEVVPDGIGRYPADIEATVYFCVLEALQNATKYADAARTVVRLAQDDGDLVFEVEDDGRGFDSEATSRGSGLQNMVDRVEALGGGLEVRTAPGQGTIVTGRIPVGSGAVAQ